MAGSMFEGGIEGDNQRKPIKFGGGGGGGGGR